MDPEQVAEWDYAMGKIHQKASFSEMEQDEVVSTVSGLVEDYPEEMELQETDFVSFRIEQRHLINQLRKEHLTLTKKWKVLNCN